jgi:hypothetical protein
VAGANATYQSAGGLASGIALTSAGGSRSGAGSSSTSGRSIATGISSATGSSSASTSNGRSRAAAEAAAGGSASSSGAETAAASAFLSLMSPTAVLVLPGSVAAGPKGTAAVSLDARSSMPIWGTTLVSYEWVATRQSAGGGAKSLETRSAKGRVATLSLVPGEWTVKLTVKVGRSRGGARHWDP